MEDPCPTGKYPDQKVWVWVPFFFLESRGFLNGRKTLVRKILVSVKFLSAILRPEMGASILWTPGKNAFFLQEKPHVHKIPRFRRGGGYFGFCFGGGGGSADFIFMGARNFSDLEQGHLRGVETYQAKGGGGPKRF